MESIKLDSTTYTHNMHTYSGIYDFIEGPNHNPARFYIHPNSHTEFFDHRVTAIRGDMHHCPFHGLPAFASDRRQVAILIYKGISRSLAVRYLKRIWMPVLISWPFFPPGEPPGVRPPWRLQTAFRCSLCGAVCGPNNRDFTDLLQRTADTEITDKTYVIKCRWLPPELVPNIAN